MNKLVLHSPLAAVLLASVAGAQSFTYTDFTSVVGINVVGMTTQAGNILRLQDNVAPVNSGDNRAAAWYSTAVCVANGFDTTFTYRMHTPSTAGGAEGLAFVIQNDPTANAVPIIIGAPDGPGNLAIGRHAAAMGYGKFAASGPNETIENSVAIELDTFNGGATWGDLDANHISVHTGGTGDNSQHENFSIGRANTATVITNLNDAAVHTVRVVYTPGTLDVYLDGVLKLTTPYSFATGGTYLIGGAAGGLNLIGGTSAYVGFVSGAGSAREFRDVLSWTWSSTCPNTPSIGSCFGDTPAQCPCSGAGGSLVPNPGAAGHGCANSVFPGGAILTTSGLALDNLGDTLVLTATDVSGPTLFFQGTAAALNILNFNDGTFCVGTGILRLGVAFPIAGVATLGAPANPIHISGAPVLGGGAPSVNDRHYQAWYRDTPTFCNLQTHNLSNAVSLTWTP